MELWGGIECTIARIGDSFRDQLSESIYDLDADDMNEIADLGIDKLRFPVLWESVAPKSMAQPRWRRIDELLGRIRQLHLKPILGLMHHGSGPRYTNLLDPKFPFLLAKYAALVARRYPWSSWFTPVNEPVTTARFSCLYGHWYPHQTNEEAFLRAVFNQCYGVALSMRAIREQLGDARLVQTDDFGKTYSRPALQYQSDYQNERRWLGMDLLCGVVDRHHPWYRPLLDAGVAPEQLRDLVSKPCPPDVVGLNYYLTSDRFLDQRLSLYPPACRGGNGRDSYADVEAIRIKEVGADCNLESRARDVWDRYHLPVAMTEIHNGCTREEQLRWLVEAYATATKLKTDGIDMRAVTVWSMLGSSDWDSLLLRRESHYEPGAFDTRSGWRLRPTAVARATAELARSGQCEHPVLDGPGWWQRKSRFFDRPATFTPERLKGRPILVTGATGTLGAAFSRICEVRGLACRADSRAQTDITDPESVEAALDRHGPWAVVNAAGYVRPVNSERERRQCFEENAAGPNNLADACARRGIPLVTFSSDRVFDGQLTRAYLEWDEPCPVDVYGTSKAEGERLVSARYPDALIVRTSAFFGPWDSYNFVAATISKLVRGVEVAVADQCKVCPTYVPDLVNTVLDLLIDQEKGVWHLTNGEAISWAEFAETIAGLAGLPSRNIEIVNHHYANTALASSHGQLLPKLGNSLERYFEQCSWRS
jgi:dTDP-4-dehydrorhamnose reductase